MDLVRKLSDDLYYVGTNDRRIALFENVYPVPDGVSYNSYMIIDEKTCLIDTVDKSGERQFKENIASLLKGGKLDYIVVNHVEPDHSATLFEIVRDYPEAKIVCNAKIKAMLGNFFDLKDNFIVVNEGDELSLGTHTLTFVNTPMVHWPEVMMTYDKFDGTLFSADAFGSFGAVSGAVYSDEIDFKGKYTDEMRRYYANIVGKYGTQVQSALKKASTLKINRICPLHGLLWRNNFDHLLEKYSRWATYTPEVKGALVVYASVYGDTENAAEILAAKLHDEGISNIAVYDVSKTDCSLLIAESFKYSHIVVASTTYNAGVFVNMENFLSDLVAHAIQNRTFAIVENGSWAPTAGKLIQEKISALKNTTVIGEKISIISSVKPETTEKLGELAKILAEDISPKTQDQSQEEGSSTLVDKAAFFTLSYGLFVVTTYGKKHNGCIVNTVIQLTETPKRILVAVNKANYSCEVISETKKFNVSVISESAPFELFKNFGFTSGRDTDKFDGFDAFKESRNGLRYITEHCSAFISAKVISQTDYGTHILFVAEVEEAKKLSDEKAMTYQYYFDNVKPKPKVEEEKKKGYVCKICGYVYEGEEIPEDFVCPLCKHGADDFEKIK
ncbi:MAG: flavin reductase [Clostridia bacterium]|nr:flavin reductase [Clostridia bacterium]